MSPLLKGRAMTYQQLPRLDFPDDMSDDIRSLYQGVIDKFQEGQVLALNRRFDEAIEAYQACLTIAAERPVPLYIFYYSDIQMSIAFAYAEQFRFKRALDVYLALVAALKREGDWYQHLRHGLMILFPDNFETEGFLANVIDSMAIAYDRLREGQKALEYFQQSVDLWLGLGRYDLAARVWYHMGTNARVRQDWERMKLAGEKMLEISQAHDLVDDTIAALQFAAQYWGNQANLDKMIEHLEMLTALERRHNHQMLAKDLALLEDMRRMRDGGKPLPEANTSAPIIPPQFWAHHMNTALDVLRRFAQEHGGPPTVEIEEKGHRLFAKTKSSMVVPRWSVGIETSHRITADGKQEAKPFAVLDLLQTPQAIICVSLQTAIDFVVLPYVTQYLPDIKEPVLMAQNPVIIPASEDSLLELLNDWLDKGWLYKEDGQLRFKGVPKTT